MATPFRCSFRPSDQVANWKHHHERIKAIDDYGERFNKVFGLERIYRRSAWRLPVTSPCRSPQTRRSTAGDSVRRRCVLLFYNRGGVPNGVLDPLIAPLGLSDAKLDDLLEFPLSLNSVFTNMAFAERRGWR